MLEYEWDVEWVDEFEDIVDHWFVESYVEAVEVASGEPLHDDCVGRIVLVRSVIGDQGVEDRAWAYLEEGFNEFQDGYGNRVCAIPKRFREEVRKENERRTAKA